MDVMQTLGRPRTIQSICTGLVAAPASEKTRSTVAQQENVSLPLASFPRLVEKGDVI
jgi:hypothetical protein